METPTPPPIPPVAGTPPKLDSANAAPGANPSEQAPIGGLVGAIEAVLREPRRVMYQLGRPGHGAITGALLFIAVVSALVYGVVVGTFSGGTQLWAAPLKTFSPRLILI